MYYYFPPFYLEKLSSSNNINQDLKSKTHQITPAET